MNRRDFAFEIVSLFSGVLFVNAISAPAMRSSISASGVLS